MDTYDIFKAYGSRSEVFADLSSRYADPSCLSFNNQLASVWENYHKVKIDVITPVYDRSVSS